MKNKINVWLAERRYFIEALLVTLTVAAILIHWLGIIKNEPLIMVTASTLAGFYFISAYFVTDVKGSLGEVFIKVTGIGSAVCIIGILFFILKMEGYAQMLMMGTSAMAGAFVLSLAFFIWSQNRQYLPFMIRTLILGVLGASMLLGDYQFP